MKHSRDAWLLRPDVTYLNHGSFGPSPRAVFQARMRLLEELEAEPVDFLARQLRPRLAEARERLGRFVGTSGDRLLFVENATTAMNLVARSLRLEADDEVLATDHEYGAMLRLWEHTCRRAGARLVVQRLPEVFRSLEEVAERILAGVTRRTRLIFLSHVTSPTAVVLPVEQVCRRARELGIPVAIDGPHALAMLPLELDALGCAFYAASCHKWLSAPFGSGFLYVGDTSPEPLEPLVMSWGRRHQTEPTTWHDEFQWRGTHDPTPYLAVPAAIEFLEGNERADDKQACRRGERAGNQQAYEEGAGEKQTHAGRGNEPEGLRAFREHGHRLAQYARRRIAAITGLEALVPDSPEFYGTMIAMPLPVAEPRVTATRSPSGAAGSARQYGAAGAGADPLKRVTTNLGETAARWRLALWERYKTEAPVTEHGGRLLLRASCHLYNTEADIDRLADAVQRELA